MRGDQFNFQELQSDQTVLKKDTLDDLIQQLSKPIIESITYLITRDGKSDNIDAGKVNRVSSKLLSLSQVLSEIASQEGQISKQHEDAIAESIRGLLEEIFFSSIYRITSLS